MTKVVVIDANSNIKARVENHTGAEHRRLANKVMELALAQACVPFTEIAYIVATGYGRINVPFADKQMTELTCHARGVVHLFPTAHTALDIGGQDAKGLKLGPNGKLLDFVMNERCAAGTGRFLEVIAGTLGLTLDQLGPLSLKSQHKISIASICTIFAQQEIVARMSEGAAIEDVLAGMHEAIASRAVRMLRAVKIQPDVVFTGGVAKNVGVVKAVSDQLGFPVLVPPDPLISGALGAALLAKEQWEAAQKRGDTLPTQERVLKEASFFNK